MTIRTGQYKLWTPEDGTLVRTSVGHGYGRYAHLPWARTLTPFGVFGVYEKRADYLDAYIARLDRQGPAVLAELEGIATTFDSPVLVLGCFCDLHKGWCHRTMAADWITANLGLEVTELHGPDISSTWDQGSLL